MEDGGGIRSFGDVDAVNTSLTFNCSILGRRWPNVTVSCSTCSCFGDDVSHDELQEVVLPVV